MCGGTDAEPITAQAAVGLSPRVRGNLRLLIGGSFGFRSIPACAGEPAVQGRICGSGGVYPRVCGGTLGPDWGRIGAGGLSPRVRGNPAAFSPSAITAGSIPACAGEPRRHGGNQMQQVVYPRVCGGTRAGQPGKAAAGGLSPRVRGNRCLSCLSCLRGRSIPACAGEPGRATW